VAYLDLISLSPRTRLERIWVSSAVTSGGTRASIGVRCVGASNGTTVVASDWRGAVPVADSLEFELIPDGKIPSSSSFSPSSYCTHLAIVSHSDQHIVYRHCYNKPRSLIPTDFRPAYCMSSLEDLPLTSVL
jgi:hypothetical protein